MDLSYILPVSRITGYELPADGNMTRVTRRFTVSGIALATGLGGGAQNGVLAERRDGQLDRRSGRGRASDCCFGRSDLRFCQHANGDFPRAARCGNGCTMRLAPTQTPMLSIAKAEALDMSDVAFAVMRSVSTVYGFLVMGGRAAALLDHQYQC